MNKPSTIYKTPCCGVIIYPHNGDYTYFCNKCNRTFILSELVKEENKPSTIEQDWIRLFQDRIKGVIGEYSSQLNDWSFVEERIVEEIQKTIPELLQSQKTKLIDEIVGLELMKDEKLEDENNVSTLERLRPIIQSNKDIFDRNNLRMRIKTKLLELKEKV